MLKPVLLSIERAHSCRKKFLEQMEIQDTNAYRLFCGIQEGIPGFIVDHYAGILIFQHHEGKCPLKTEEMKTVADWYLEAGLARSVYLKRFIPDRSHQTAEEPLYSELPFAGEVGAPSIEMRENGLRFLVHPYEGFSTGIFLDQRENRKYLSELSKGKRVLNCFAYTCAFSVYAAHRGGQVTSIDLSRKFLEWGKENFRANQLPPESHEFYSCDVFEHFKKAKKLNKTYEMIILDPPSFSRGNQAKPFSVKQDMARLVAGAAELLVEGGVLFVSANYSAWDNVQLKKQVALGLQESARGFEWMTLPGDPFDFEKQEHPLSACLVQRY